MQLATQCVALRHHKPAVKYASGDQGKGNSFNDGQPGSRFERSEMVWTLTEAQYRSMASECRDRDRKRYIWWSTSICEVGGTISCRTRRQGAYNAQGIHLQLIGVGVL